MRVFIAIELAEELRQNIAAAQASLKKLAGIKWVEPENLHLTLRFLGETDMGTVSRLANEMTALAQAVPEFPLGFAGAGVFPDERRPRVVWIGMKEGLQPLFALAQKVEAVCQQLGFEAEHRPFRAHLTLGRNRTGLAVNGLKELLAGLAEKEFGTQTVNYITLMESTLMRTGPIYKPLHKFQLQTLPS